MSAARRSPSLLLIATLGVSVATPGMAAPAGTDAPSSTQQAAAPEASAAALAQAREAFRRGAALAKREQWQAAIASFQQSYALKPHPVTSYDIGFCERALQHDTRARQMFKRAFEEQRAGTEGSLPADLAELGKRYLDEVEARLARAEVLVDAADTLVLVDGAPLEVDGAPLETDSGPAPAGLPVVVAGTSAGGAPQVVPAQRFLVLLDAGQHSFTFARPGLAERVITQTFTPGSRSFIEQTTPHPPRQQPPAIPASTPPSAHRTAHRIWAYVALSAGAVGLVTGGVSGALALHKRSGLDEKCGPDHKTCPSRAGIESMDTFADLSTVGFALAAVGVSVGLGLYLWGPSSSKPLAAARLTFEVEPSYVGLAGNF